MSLEFFLSHRGTGKDKERILRNGGQRKPEGKCKETVYLKWPPSSSLTIVFALKSTLSYMNIATLAFFLLVFTWNIFFHTSTFKLSLPLNLKLVSCRQHTVGSFFLPIWYHFPYLWKTFTFFVVQVCLWWICSAFIYLKKCLFSIHFLKDYFLLSQEL